MKYNLLPIKRKKIVKYHLNIKLLQTCSFLINIKNNMKISRDILALLILLITTNSAIFNKEINNVDPNALCLNGAQSFVYTQSKTITSPDGILVYFMPTPTPIFCGGNTLSNSLDNCAIASDQVSSFWTNQLNLTSGILDDPTYDNWDKVIIPSCDGSLYQGYATNPTKYKGKDLYFRGNKVVKSNLDYIFHKKYNSSKASNFVLAGSGFGAIGALIWSRYTNDQIILNLGKNKHFSLLLDSIPFSYNSFKTKANQYDISLRNLLKLANTEELPPFILCTLRNQGAEQKCFKLEQTYFYLNFPIMLIDSQYDQISAALILEINCIEKASGSLSGCTTAERSYLDRYREYKLLKHYSLVNFHDNSVWSISCSAETFLNNVKYNDQKWSVNGKVSQNTKLFILNSRVSNLNYQPWPSNEACSGSP